MHNNKSAYSASLYVDDHGEEDPGLRRGRPLFLNEARYRALETLWRQQGIPREVAQIRSTSDRVIRDNCKFSFLSLNFFMFAPWMPSLLHHLSHTIVLFSRSSQGTNLLPINR